MPVPFATTDSVMTASFSTVSVSTAHFNHLDMIRCTGQLTVVSLSVLSEDNCTLWGYSAVRHMFDKQHMAWLQRVSCELLQIQPCVVEVSTCISSEEQAKSNVFVCFEMRKPQ